MFGLCEPGTTPGGEAENECDKTKTELQEKRVKHFRQIAVQKHLIPLGNSAEATRNLRAVAQPLTLLTKCLGVITNFAII